MKVLSFLTPWQSTQVVEHRGFSKRENGLGFQEQVSDRMEANSRPETKKPLNVSTISLFEEETRKKHGALTLNKG